jgi:hypothetical protein
MNIKKLMIQLISIIYFDDKNYYYFVFRIMWNSCEFYFTFLGIIKNENILKPTKVKI